MSKTTEEKSRALAELLGAKTVTSKPKDQRMVIECHFPNGADSIAIKDMKFHSSYDWIMSVVEKIGSMGHRIMFKTDEGQHYCEIWCYSDQGYVIHEIECEEDESGTMISALHEGCYQFAVWHKENS